MRRRNLELSETREFTRPMEPNTFAPWAGIPYNPPPCDNDSEASRAQSDEWVVEEVEPYPEIEDLGVMEPLAIEDDWAIEEEEDPGVMEPPAIEDDWGIKEDE